MCQINYTTFPTCTCIFLHKAPTYCPHYLALHPSTPPPFEAKLITHHPALTGLLLFRDHIRFQSHTISAAIRPEKFTCEECTEVGVESGKGGEGAEARCPLCSTNKDVIDVMVDAAAGCDISAGKIKRRVERERERGLWCCEVRRREKVRGKGVERKERVESEISGVSAGVGELMGGVGRRRVVGLGEEGEVGSWESDWDSEEDWGEEGSDDEEEEEGGEFGVGGDGDGADEGVDEGVGGETKQKREREDEAGVEEYGKKLRTLLGDLKAIGGR